MPHSTALYSPQITILQTHAQHLFYSPYAAQTQYGGFLSPTWIHRADINQCPCLFLGYPSAGLCISLLGLKRGDCDGAGLSPFLSFLFPSSAVLKPSCQACNPWVCPYKAKANRAWKWCPWQGCADKHSLGEDRLCSPERGTSAPHSCSPGGIMKLSEKAILNDDTLADEKQLNFSPLPVFCIVITPTTSVFFPLS